MHYTSQTFDGDSLRGQDVQNVAFSSCRLIGDLKFSSFKACTFVSCDFSGVQLEATLFQDCRMEACKLNHLDFGQTTLSSVDFTDSLLLGCVFQRLDLGNHSQRKKLSLKGCTFNRAQLARSAFVLANLESVSFIGADLEHTSFDRCQLLKTNLSQANLSGTNFHDCRIDRALLSLDGFITFGQSKGFVLTEGEYSS